MPRTFWVETLGCPKNQVDSDKLTGHMLDGGLTAAESPEAADLIVVNTCAFVEEAREESIATVLELDDARGPGAELVLTGCMAERYGDELAGAMPEADVVAGFGVPVELVSKSPERKAILVGSEDVPAFDLLNLPRPTPESPWAYVKIAEGCDKACGFCAIPSFRGPQRSRDPRRVIEEVRGLGVREVVLVAQDLGAYGRDVTGASGARAAGARADRADAPIVELYDALSQEVDWVRLLYLFPSELTDALMDRIAGSAVPYFDLSLQHVSAPLLRRMRRPGDGGAYMERIDRIRSLEPEAAFRSNFIVGYPGETESDHDELLEFVQAARLDWCGFFSYSEEVGTHAAGLDHKVPRPLVDERLAELRELQDTITADKRDELIGAEVTVLVDESGLGRTHREAPEIDGMVWVPEHLEVGGFHRVVVTGVEGPDLVAGDAIAADAAGPQTAAEVVGQARSGGGTAVAG